MSLRNLGVPENGSAMVRMMDEFPIPKKLLIIVKRARGMANVREKGVERDILDGGSRRRLLG